MNNRISIEEEDEILKAYAELKSFEAVGLKFNRSGSTISRLIKKKGAQQFKFRRQSFTQEEKELMVKYYTIDQMSAKEIAEKMNCNETYVFEIFKQMNVTLNRQLFKDNMYAKKQEVIDLYNQGYGCVEIERRTGVPEHYIFKFLAEENIKIRNGGKFDKCVYPKIAEDYQKGDSVLSICEKYNCYKYNVFQAIEMNDIPRREKRVCYPPMTLNSFLTDALLQHGDHKYGYDQVEFIDSTTEVEIFCHDHNGYFWQKPRYHLCTENCCNVCYNPKMTLEKFLEEAILTHPDERFDYSRVEIVNTRTKIEIFCRHHEKWFEQSINSHLSGAGCDECRKENISKAKMFSQEEFIAMCEAVNGDKFTYESTVYNGMWEPVTVTCKIHGLCTRQASRCVETPGPCKLCNNSAGKSHIADEWLDFTSLPNDSEHREVKKEINGKYISLDGFDPNTNTAYEFHGTYWHGDMRVYDRDDLNKRCCKTYGELYDKTIQREEEIKKSGMGLVVMWEKDWKDFKRSQKLLK